MKQIAAGLFFGALCAFLIYLLGPPLMSDFGRDAKSLVPARGVAVNEAKCKTYVFVVAFCNVKLTGRQLAGGSQRIEYLMLGRPGGESVRAMQSPGSGPASVTTSFGMSHLTNRLVSFLVLTGLIGAMALAGLWSGIKSLRD